MPKLTTVFAKIAASPTPHAWAQVYHAGNVYAVVSVQQKTEKEEDPEHALPSVHVLGKDIINNIEAEYFTIVDKNLQTIKEAIAASCENITDNVSVGVLVAVVIEKILYVFLYGKGNVFIKRGDMFGNILQQPSGSNKQDKNVAAASGFIEPHDIVLLTTQQFLDAIAPEEIKNAAALSTAELEDKFSDIIDSDAHAGAAMASIRFGEPHLAEEPKGGAIRYPPKVPNEPKEPEGSLSKDETLAEKISGDSSFTKNSTDTTLNGVNKSVNKLDEVKKQHIPSEPLAPVAHMAPTEEPISLKDKHHLEDEFEDKKQEEQTEKPRKKLPFRRIFFLALAIVLACILGITILKSIHKKTDDQSTVLFNSEFPAAQQKYNEGNSLLSLNKNIAQDDFQKAKSTLEDLKAKLPVSSSYQTQVQDLMTKVDQALGTTSNAQQTPLTAADNGSKLLADEAGSHEAAYAAQDDNSIYLVNGDSVFANDKKIISYSNSNTIGGFGAYIGNIYILDKKDNQIYKFTKSDTSYDKSNYLKTSADVSKAVSLSIDGSIWVLSSDGSLQKFTKGNTDQFTMQTLQKPLSNPTRIFTNADIDNIYILDPQNMRILQMKKSDGSLVKEFDAKELKNAKDIDVDEKNKKIYVLIGEKIYSMDLK